MTHPAHTSEDLRKGFTLIELSIVLVIIGLITGGVLVGSDMIHQAKLRKVISEVEGLKTAINLYKIKYNALPGDHNKAQQIFGATACPDYLSGVQPCNGNGNQKIDGQYETNRPMQHLNLAGLVEGSYTGSHGAETDRLWKRSTINDGLYNVGTIGVLYRQNGKNMISLGARVTAGGSNLNKSVINAPDAFSIDAKMDDGVAWTGKVLSTNGEGITLPADRCTTQHTATPSEYIMTQQEISCVMRFLL